MLQSHAPFGIWTNHFNTTQHKQTNNPAIVSSKFVLTKFVDLIAMHDQKTLQWNLDIYIMNLNVTKSLE